jgi:ATP-dependent Lhr-like helicase
MRFLLDWQRVTSETRMEGSEALPEIVSQLEGFEAPASAWESEIIASRITHYDPDWLDDQCLAGRIAWARLRPRNGKGGERRAAPVRATPITLVPRRHLGAWAGQAGVEEPAPLTATRQRLPTTSARTAHRFLTSCEKARGCCGRSSRTPWRSWSLWEL